MLCTAYLDQVRGDGKSSWLWGDMEDDDVGDGRLEGHAADGQTDMRGFSWRSGRQRCTTVSGLAFCRATHSY